MFKEGVRELLTSFQVFFLVQKSDWIFDVLEAKIWPVDHHVDFVDIDEIFVIQVKRME